MEYEKILVIATKLGLIGEEYERTEKNTKTAKSVTSKKLSLIKGNKTSDRVGSDKLPTHGHFPVLYLVR